MKSALTIALVLISTLVFAQPKNAIQGTYIGKVRHEGFVNELKFKGNKLIVNKDPAYGYGVVHTFIYRLTYLADTIHFEQVKHRAKKMGNSSGIAGDLNNKNQWV